MTPGAQPTNSKRGLYAESGFDEKWLRESGLNEAQLRKLVTGFNKLIRMVTHADQGGSDEQTNRLTAGITKLLAVQNLSNLLNARLGNAVTEALKKVENSRGSDIARLSNELNQLQEVHRKLFCAINSEEPSVFNIGPCRIRLQDEVKRVREKTAREIALDTEFFAPEKKAPTGEDPKYFYKITVDEAGYIDGIQKCGKQLRLLGIVDQEVAFQNIIKGGEYFIPEKSLNIGVSQDVEFQAYHPEYSEAIHHQTFESKILPNLEYRLDPKSPKFGQRSYFLLACCTITKDDQPYYPANSDSHADELLMVYGLGFISSARTKGQRKANQAIELLG